jgi:hypothetical protein
MQDAPPISFFLLSSPEWYIMRGVHHKAPHYAVLSTPLLVRLS